MTNLYESIPPEREIEYLNNAAQVAGDLEDQLAWIQGDLIIQDAEAVARDFSGPSVVDAAEAITKQDDLSHHFMDAMDSARLGVPGLVIAGFAKSEDIAEYANKLVRSGIDPDVVQEELRHLQMFGGDLISARKKGMLSYTSLADYGNDLLRAGFEPDHVMRMLQRAAVGPTKVVSDIVDKPPRIYGQND